MLNRLRIGMALAAIGLSGCGQVSGLETEARILASPPCTDFFFPIYFSDRSPDLGAPAARVIRNAGRQAQGCRGTKVEVVGVADPAQPGSNLSRERARRLAEALQASGLPAAGFQANALGAAQPPRERNRIDVFVRFER